MLEVVGILFLKFNAKILYFFLKLLPTRNKMVLISRFHKTKSIDFKLIESNFKKVYPDYKVVVLNHKMRNKFSHLFDVIIEMYHLATSKVCIVDSYIIPVSILKHKNNLFIIQIWHALGAIKKFGHDAIDKREGSSQRMATLMNMHKNYDYVVCGGKGSIPCFSSAFNIEIDKIKPLGLPRVDYLLNKTQLQLNRNQIYKDYKQLTYKKNILYVPTFRKGDSLKIDELIKNINFKKYNLIIKKHPADKTKIINDKIIIDKKYNVLELLSIADYVITDYSAVAFECAVLEKPLFFYVYDIDKYKEVRGLNINLFKEMKGYTFKNINDLLFTLNKDNYNYEQLIKFKNKFVSITNISSTEEILNLIEEHLLECEQKEKTVIKENVS